MKKEKLFLKAMRLCSEIEALGFITNLSITNKYNMISCNIHEYENFKVGTQLHCRFYFYDQPSESNIISDLQNFINQHKQVA